MTRDALLKGGESELEAIQQIIIGTMRANFETEIKAVEAYINDELKIELSASASALHAQQISANAISQSPEAVKRQHVQEAAIQKREIESLRQSNDAMRLSIAQGHDQEVAALLTEVRQLQSDNRTAEQSRNNSDDQMRAVFADFDSRFNTVRLEFQQEMTEERQRVADEMTEANQRLWQQSNNVRVLSEKLEERGRVSK